MLKPLTDDEINALLQEFVSVLHEKVRGRDCVYALMLTNNTHTIYGCNSRGLAVAGRLREFADSVEANAGKDSTHFIVDGKLVGGGSGTIQ